MLTFEEFKQASAVVEKIVQDNFDINTAKNVLEQATEEIAPEKQRNFYNHMSRLFLNVMLNRLNELGKKAKTNAIIARQMITELIQEQRKKGEVEHV